MCLIISNFQVPMEDSIKIQNELPEWRGLENVSTAGQPPGSFYSWTQMGAEGPKIGSFAFSRGFR